MTASGVARLQLIGGGAQRQFDAATANGVAGLRRRSSAMQGQISAETLAGLHGKKSGKPHVPYAKRTVAWSIERPRVFSFFVFVVK